jgi:S-adenosylmethionine-diacylgycerolhomoserine-N-methlytransferase
VTSPCSDDLAASEAARAMNAMYRYQRYIYDATRKFYLLGRDGLIAGLDPPPGGRILELGCGTGRNLVKAAHTFPKANFYGLDVSDLMLDFARRSVAREGLAQRIVTARADATSFDPARLFAVSSFDRIFVSYALSMIPNWRDVLARASGYLAEGGSLHIVDFGDQAGLPRACRLALDRWLALFSVHPCPNLEAELQAFAAAHAMQSRFERRFRGYTFCAILTKGEATASDAKGEQLRNSPRTTAWWAGWGSNPRPLD